MKYRYYNDDRSLLRVGPNEVSEQWTPEGEWAPGGYPSYRAARLDYEQADELAYIIVNSFGDQSKLESLNIGPEDYDESNEPTGTP